MGSRWGKNNSEDWRDLRRMGVVTLAYICRVAFEMGRLKDCVTKRIPHTIGNWFRLHQMTPIHVTFFYKSPSTHLPQYRRHSLRSLAMRVHGEIETVFALGIRDDVDSQGLLVA
jgi:hypothetical protein